MNKSDPKIEIVISTRTSTLTPEEVEEKVEPDTFEEAEINLDFGDGVFSRFYIYREALGALGRAIEEFEYTPPQEDEG